VLPDVIISDLQMPKMNGFEFLPVMRKRFPQIPIPVSASVKGGTLVLTVDPKSVTVVSLEQ
jgi:CheY-like chemotaxis protein